MKKIVFTLALFLLGLNITVQGNVPSRQIDPYYYYVVVGVFKYHKNAIRYTDFSNQLGLTTDYAYHPTRDLYYVYIFYHQMKAEAVKVTLETRETQKYTDANPMFEDTWVLGAEDLEALTWNLPSQPYDPSLAQIADIVDAEANGIRVEEDSTMTNGPGPVDVTSTTAEEAKDDDDKDRFVVYFDTFNGTNLKEVQTEISIVDAVRGRKLGTEPSHQYVTIENPNRSGEVRFVSEMFGYRILEHPVNLYKPQRGDAESYVDVKGDTLIIHFELVRYRVGDLVVMYNVYFYKDAALIRPESQHELDELLAMLKENPNYKIKIHGHTNGNSRGPIIRPAEEETNFFSLNGNVENARGSAKRLSQDRADVMKKWLLQQGISEERIETRGWGGNRMLYDRKGPNADKNVRVEIEVLEE